MTPMRTVAINSLCVELDLDVQYATTCSDLPSIEAVRGWVEAVLVGRRDAATLTVRIVDELEAKTLNRRYRQREGATNVLSFPTMGLKAIAPDLIGDIVICAPLVAEEARTQCKSTDAHWAHLVVHGALHLLGFDHVDSVEARSMEQLETAILAGLEFPDPYRHRIEI